MSFPLKTLSRDAIPRALDKADRYRFLNEPVQAESICLDILRTDPDNQAALVTLLLALTDQFGRGYKMSDIQPAEILHKLSSDYERAYYSGIVAERKAETVLEQDQPHSKFLAHDFLKEAMAHYDAAAEIRPAGNDDALLRWNTCARMMNSAGVQEREHGDERFLE